jgi:hypothetical protein
VTRIVSALVLVGWVAACGPPAKRPPPVISNKADSVSYSAGYELDAIRRHLAESAAATWTVELEPSGRFVRRDSSDKYEEDFYLRDVTTVVYEYVGDWEKPHVARVVLIESAETKYRYGDVEWTSSSDKKVSFAFRTKAAAEAVVEALRHLVASH